MLFLVITSALGACRSENQSSGAIAKTPSALEVAPTARRLSTNQLRKLPVRFEENRGQADARVKFLVRAGEKSLLLTGNEAIFGLAKAPEASGKRASRDRTALRMKFLGADPRVAVVGAGADTGKSHVLLGRDKTKWRKHVPTYDRVRYQGLYPGVDLEFYGSDGELEYDFVLGPRADPSKIALAFQGAKTLKTTAEGHLQIQTDAGVIRFRKPVAFQDRAGASGARLAVAGRFVVREDKGDKTVRFEVGPYDTSRRLVIDPVLELDFSTFWGGAGEDGAVDVTTDDEGFVSLTGYTRSADFPTQTGPGWPFAPGLGLDAFVVKLDVRNLAAPQVVFATYLGGDDDDVGRALYASSSGSLWVTGTTRSSNFPVLTWDPLQPANGTDIFVAGLYLDGSDLFFGRVVGGTDGAEGDQASDIVVNDQGEGFVTGWTDAVDFPVTDTQEGACFQTTHQGGLDALIFKIDYNGRLMWASFLGGPGDDRGTAVALQGTSNVFFGGTTTSSNLPVQSMTTGEPPVDSTLAGQDAFMARVATDGASLRYLTYLGGTGVDAIAPGGIAVDSGLTAYVAGTTFATDFPVVGAYQSTNRAGSGGSNAFVARLNATATQLLYATYLGGTSSDAAHGIAVDGTGKVFVTGAATSTTFPVTGDAHQGVHAGGANDAFLVKLDPAASGAQQLLYGTYLGGSGIDVAERTGIDLDGAGNLYLSGVTSSPNFPLRVPFQPGLAGNRDAWVARFRAMAGAPTCNDGNPCTTDGVNPNDPTSCLFVPVAAGTSCADSTVCNGQELCNGSGLCVAGTPLTCDDGNACTSDSCDASTGCAHASAPLDGTSCGAGTACQTAICQTGACTNVNVANGTACTDGDACTQTDSCSDGTCTGSDPVTCVAQSACHVAGVCDPATGQCSHPARPAGASCADDNACNGAETCDGAGQCVAGSPLVCNDGNACTADSCNATAGCVFDPAPLEGSS